MLDRAFVRRVAAIRSVPGRIIALTALASYAGQLFALVQGWPLWAIGLATLLPWIPLFTMEMVWTYRHYQWLALFYILVITQGGHVVEHLVQIVQLHFLGVAPAEARGIFGQLDIEWVHFTWNTWVLIAVVLLLSRWPRNPWLWVTAVLAGWHELEHVVIMSRFLETGKAGFPGLLARGGLLGGGLSLRRPELHFLYNVVETTPLVIAFVWQLRRSYDEWLKRAFPRLSEQALADTTNHLRNLRFNPGEVIVAQGAAADRFYIVSRGEVEVVRRDPTGQEATLAVLQAGQYFGEIGLMMGLPRTASVRARMPVEVLALDREVFQRVVEASEATADDLAAIAQDRLARVQA